MTEIEPRAGARTESVLGSQIEVSARPIPQIKRRLGRLEFDRAVVQDLFELRLQLLDIRMHEGIVCGALPDIRLAGRRLLNRADLVDDLPLGWEPSLIVLAEHASVIDRHVEPSAAASNDFAIDPELILELGRQTGGPGKVISNAAIVDSNTHQIPQTTSSRIVVTLSEPPFAFATSTSCSQAFSRSSRFSSTILRISSSGTMPVSPSEQSR